MKVYERYVDQKELGKDVYDICCLENNINKEYTKVYNKIISEEIYSIFTSKLETVKEKQSLLKSKKKPKIEKKVIFNELKEYRIYLKNLNKNLKKYKEILELYAIGKKHPDWLYKILGKDEFHTILDTDLDLIMFLSRYSNSRLNLYRKILIQLRTTIHEIDIENIK